MHCHCPSFMMFLRGSFKIGLQDVIKHCHIGQSRFALQTRHEDVQISCERYMRMVPDVAVLVEGEDLCAVLDRRLLCAAAHDGGEDAAAAGGVAGALPGGFRAGGGRSVAPVDW